MALTLEENPPELYLGETQNSFSVPSSELSPKIFGPNPWAAALTGYQKEKTLARWLLQQGIPYFLPMQRSNTAGSSNRTYKPVFDGVIFFQAHTEIMPVGYYSSVTPCELEVRRHKHVYSLLKTGAQAKLKLDLTLLASEDRDNRTLLPEKCLPGVKVRITDGPFKYLEGFIRDFSPRKTRVTVDFLGGAFKSVELSTALLEAV